MLWKRWFRPNRSARSRRTPQTGCRVRLGFESLEVRTTPTTTLLSFLPPSTIGNGPSQTSGSTGAAFSAAGNLVVFSSDANNLVEGDTNSATDVFLENLATGAITRISVGPNGEQANDSSLFPSISANGRFVAFQSYASNLVGGDTNGTSDVFVKDLQTGAVTLVSADKDGIIGDNFSSQPAISVNGQYVVFSSSAANLAPGDNDSVQDVFRKSLATGAIDLVSAGSGETKGNQDSSDPAISADGSFVAFDSSANNLIPGIDTGGHYHVYRKSIADQSLALVSADGSGTIGNGDSSGPVISGDGTIVAFTSTADNLVAGDANGVSDVFVKKMITHETVRISIASGGVEPDAASNSPSISTDGRYVAFASGADNIADGDANFATDIFIRDLTGSSVVLASRNSAGDIGNSGSTTPKLRGDGFALLFTSDAVNLTATETDWQENVYLSAFNHAPTISIAGDTTIDPAQSLSLNAAGTTDADGDTLAFAWDLNGDGDFSDATGPTISIAPAQLTALGIGAGVHHARLRVADASGPNDLAFDLTILTTPPVINALNAPSTGLEGTPITFTPDVAQVGDAGGSGNLTYAWTVLKDGVLYMTGTTPKVSFKPDDNAVYTFTLNVTDSLGVAAAPASATITVDDVPENLNIAPTASADDGVPYLLALTATDPGSDTITSWTINWGDGSDPENLVGTATSASHTYVGPANRTVDVTASDEDGNYTARQILTVRGADPTVSLSGSTSVHEGSTFTLNIDVPANIGDLPSDGYRVDWGDGEITNGSGALPASVDHIYANGPLTPTITLSLMNGAQTYPNPATLSLTVEDVAPTMSLDAPAAVDEGSEFTIQLGPVVDPGSDPVTSYVVNWGDGSTSAADGAPPMSLKHTYAAGPTSRSITITITNADGTFDVGAATIAVNNVAPTFNVGSDANLNVGDTLSRDLSFTDPGADTWTLSVDYGDGPVPLTSEGKAFSLSHRFDHAGNFNVAVTIDDGSGSVTHSFQVQVADASPIVSAGADQTLSLGVAFISSGSFTSTVANGWTATVDFGDGTGVQDLTLSGNTFSLNHTYTHAGQFTVTVAVHGAAGSGTDTLIVSVNNQSLPTPTLTPAATVDEGIPWNTIGNLAEAAAETWTATVNFGDGSAPQDLTLSGTTFLLNHTYASNGTFTVTVTISDGTTTSTAATTATIANVAPVISVGGDASLLVGQPFSRAGTFTDPGQNTWSATVDYGDGSGPVSLPLNADKTFMLNHTYTASGAHVVTVRIDDGVSAVEKTFSVDAQAVREQQNPGGDPADKGDDFLGRDPVTGHIFVARSTGHSFTTTDYLGAFDPKKTWLDILTGDFDGNSFDDAIGRDKATGEWWLAKNTGGKFVVTRFDSWSAGNWTNVMVADMNGDGKADIVGRNAATGLWWCSVSNGLTGTSQDIGGWDTSQTYSEVQAYDLNHDGRIDLIGRVVGTGNFVASFNEPSTTAARSIDLNNLLRPWAVLDDGDVDNQSAWVDVRIADIDGDGNIDFLGRVNTTALWYVCYGTAGIPSPAQYLTAWKRGFAYTSTLIGDVNGDGAADLIGRLQATGRWVVATLPKERTTPVVTSAWSTTSVAVGEVFVGDFNHDGKADVANLVTATGRWTVGISTGTDFTFTDWDTWPTNPARLTIRRAKIAL